MRQPTLFEKQHGENAANDERLLLFALGDFQARGKILAERDLPLDRLRGAFKRASDLFGVAELSDERAAAALEMLGARVRRVPSFVAKHPFRVVVPAELAQRAAQAHREMVTKS